jgi:hypothetical protein
MAFAGHVDHFGIEAEGWEILKSTKTARAMARADARDEENDIVDSTWYGNTAGTLFDATVEWVLKSGSLVLSAISIGELATGKFLGSFVVATSQDGWPKITATGVLGTSAMTAPSGKTNKFALPAITITGAKRAQPLGFTTTAGCVLTGSEVSASVDIAEQADGEGEPCAHGLSGGVLTGSGTFTGTTGSPAWSVTLSDAEETQSPGDETAEAGYNTGTGTYEYILERGTTPPP